MLLEYRQHLVAVAHELHRHFKSLKVKLNWLMRKCRAAHCPFYSATLSTHGP